MILCIYPWTCGLHLSMVNISGTESFRKDKLSLPTAIIVSSLVRHMTLCSSSFSVLGFHLAWVCTGLMNAATFHSCESFTFEKSRKHCFLLSLTTFGCYSLSTVCSRLGGKGYATDVLFRAEHSVVSCFQPLNGLWVFVLITIYCQKKLLW